MSSNSYLIEDGKRLMIDAGMEPVDRKLKTGDIDILVLTHCHFDHIASAAEIQKKTGCEIWMSEAEAAFFERHKEDASASNFFGIPAELNFTINKRLKTEDVISLGKTRLEVIVTPGHTPGGLCLYEPESKALFSGDTVFAQGYGRFDLLGGDAEALSKSITSLAKLDIKKLYPGHGPTRDEDVAKYLKSIEV